MTIYPIVTALTGFQSANLLSYLLQVVPTLSGYYKGAQAQASQSIAMGPQQLATANLRLLFLPAYLPFLNPIKEVFGWLKQVVKQGTPTGTKYLFDLLQARIHTLPAETVAKFYDHTDFFIPVCLAKQPIN
ncbi:hypothetical protein DSO57_1012884 [Entomophthora muscae]|uniref:Uncharacterized protein n=1 Tax=Entomophthora muscae TaxID=34485 RepID=A0ACC2TU06_9FUNG|nr:hypothetical protein DSO57_1012884 [Entomophthora muscae]